MAISRWKALAVALLSLIALTSCGSSRRREKPVRPTSEETESLRREVKALRDELRSLRRPTGNADNTERVRVKVRTVYDPCEVPGSLECYLARSKELFNDADYNGAAELLEKAVRHYRNNDELLALLGRAYLRLRKLPRARHFLEKAIEANPYNSQAQFDLQELNRLDPSPPTSLLIWVQVRGGRIYRHSMVTEVPDRLYVESSEKKDGVVYVHLRGKTRRDLHYLLVLPYLPDGRHWLVARRQ